MMSDHSICSGCGRSYKASGLVRHQVSCVAYVEQEHRRLARWRTNNPSGFVPTGFKRRRLEETDSQAVESSAAGTAATQGNPSAAREHQEESPLSRAADADADVPIIPPDLVAGRPQRLNRGRLPARFRDNIPEGPVPIPPVPVSRVPSPTPSSVSSSAAFVPHSTKTRTAPNQFGLIREYDGALPSVDPEDEVGVNDLLDDSAISWKTLSGATRRGLLIAPYPNMSSYLFGRWFWNGSATKSDTDRADLLKNCILHPEFDPRDLHGLNWKKLDDELASSGPGSGVGRFGSGDGWKPAAVTISVPLGSAGGVHDYTVNGLLYRPLQDVIATVCASELSAGFHYTPYRKLWQPPSGPDGQIPPLETVHGELYTSQAFLDAHLELQRSPPEPGCTLPRAVIACMPWSDSTHLAEYGNASLWPTYMLFGNQTKYERGRPSSNACHHVAYIPKLPSDIEDLINKHVHVDGIDKILTHCRRELMQGVWRVMLSDEFVHAYRHGIVVKCYDGVTRRLYPRFFTYSADYPEKVLLATIRDMGSCPCPRCLVRKDAISAVGTARDMASRTRNARVDSADRRYKVNRAREFIYEQGRGLGSKAVEDLLKAESLVPTVNVFSERLSPLLPNFHELFVPDFLHEWELGVWKNLMIHLIRILHAESGNAVREFNARFRQVPIFGRDTIRRMSRNMSEMKQMAARDFEDALQSFIPVIESLLQQAHNDLVLDLLWDTASVHALHKLRMHTDTTVNVVSAFFRIFTNTLRRFKAITCAAYKTAELPKEAQARVRRQTQKSLRDTARAAPPPQAASADQPPTVRRKEYNMNTYKLHSLGDYPLYIIRVGTLDSYTTQIGELAHRIAKERFARTSKKDFTTQLAKIERRETHLKHMSENMSLSMHHHIGQSQKVYEYLPQFVHKYRGDPAAKDFVRRLKAHLLRRIIQASGETSGDAAEPTDEQLQAVLFNNDRIYRHQTMRVNYTTYDVRRGQDIVHVGTDHCHIMVHANEDIPDADSEGAPEPAMFWYAKVLGIYHVNVLDRRTTHSDLRPVRMEFLHVRWFGRDPDWRSGWEAKRLDRVGFVPESDEGAFDFVDPADVIRACHLIPAFAEGRTTSLLGPSSLARTPSENHEDWERYYVNRFVDRDMFMRYLGGAVGHGTLLVPSVRNLCAISLPDYDSTVAPQPSGVYQTYQVMTC
ncbi:hypothetical protein FKP32DRAFT_1657872 [Trametes sanguinea]|nr:hypothetical protein FKP32DRAFT_1657872 [Trametes sanguinea]